MCKVIIKNSKGRIVRREAKVFLASMRRVSAVGVYESGIRRSQRMSMKFGRGGNQAVSPFKIE